MQYNSGLPGGIVTDFATSCSSSATWYKFIMQKMDAVDDYWSSWMILESNGGTQWSAPHDPINMAWTPEDADIASEVLNERRDQSGGGNASRLTFDAAYWWTNTMGVVNVNMSGAERICDYCDASPIPGPYNTRWFDGNTFEVWTDGF